MIKVRVGSHIDGPTDFSGDASYRLQVFCKKKRLQSFQYAISVVGQQIVYVTFALLNIPIELK